MKSILITGGAGFIGAETVRQALAISERVFVVDDLSTGRRENLPASNRLSFYQLDITEKNFSVRLAEMIPLYPEAVIHLAAQPSLQKSFANPEQDIRINAVGTLNVLRFARASRSNFVLASTSAVYSPQAIPPFRESDPLLPVVPYGVSKLAAELYTQLSDLPFTIIRYGNVYGEGQIEVGENQLVPHILRHIFKGAPFRINGDGEQVRDFIHVADIARANLFFASLPAQGIINCGWGKGVSVNAIYKWLAGYLHFTREAIHAAPKAGELRRSFLDTTRLSQAGFTPEITLEQGLKRTADHWQELNA